MAIRGEQQATKGIHPLHAALLASTVPLYLGGLFSDLAYSSSYEIQWSNFAAWLIAGGTVFTALALLWAIGDLARAGRRGGRLLIYFLLLLAVFVLGLINSFVHARDAWASMPTGLILSTILALLSMTATGIGFTSLSGNWAER